MSVYLVTMDWHYETYVVGVFESKEKAENEIKKQLANPPTDGSYVRYNLEEMELQ